MENSFIDEKASFKKKVEKTRYCRINAFKRCKEWQWFLLFLSFVYNLCLVILSLLSISFFNNNYIFSIIIAISSVVVFATSLFVAGLDYSKKANEFSHCYQELDSIIREIEASKNEDDLTKTVEKYDLIMKFSPNHEECDYYRFKTNYPDESDSEDNRKAFRKAYNRYVIQTTILRAVLTFVVFYPIYCLIIFVALRIKNGKSQN